MSPDPKWGSIKFYVLTGPFYFLLNFLCVYYAHFLFGLIDLQEINYMLSQWNISEMLMIIPPYIIFKNSLSETISCLFTLWHSFLLRYFVSVSLGLRIFIFKKSLHLILLLIQIWESLIYIILYLPFYLF